jgi:cobalt/nickel transport system permease protein
MVSLLPVGAYPALLLAWLGLVALATVAHLGPWRTARGAFFALPFMLAALPLVFTRPGDPLGTAQLGPLAVTVSGEGLRQFTTIALKSWVSVQAALLLSFTTPFHALVDGLRELRLPRIMVAIISFMYRYLDVLAGEAGRMSRARAARSAAAPSGRGGGTLRWRASVTGHMVGSLFLRSYERSERIYAAMLARGFDGELRSMPGPPLSTGTLVAFASALAVLVAFELAAHVWIPTL